MQETITEYLRKRYAIELFLEKMQPENRSKLTKRE